MGTKEGRKIYGEYAGRFKGFYLETTGQLGSRGVWQQDAVGRGFMWAMLWAMEPDVFDHVDHDTGRARAVFPVAVISVVIGIGKGCAGVVRQCLTALAGNQGNLAEAAAQTDGRTSFIGIGFILIPLAVSGVLAFALRFYKLDEEYPEIRRELDRRYKKE